MADTPPLPDRIIVKAHLKNSSTLQKDAAREIGISEATLSEWLNGKRDCSEETRKKLAAWWKRVDSTAVVDLKIAELSLVDPEPVPAPNLNLKDRPGFVYILTEVGNGKRVKIGRTSDITTRLRNLGTGNPDLRLESAMHFTDYVQAETDLHKRFEKSRDKTNREWFSVAPKDAAAALYDLYMK
jgi:transcriptional regulator with XRE-family HTH domain